MGVTGRCVGAYARPSHGSKASSRLPSFPEGFSRGILLQDRRLRAEWLSYREAQTLTGLGRTTLWRLAKDGKIPVAGYGRARRLNRKALEQYMWSCVAGLDEA